MPVTKFVRILKLLRSHVLGARAGELIDGWS
jgi:hypothetical protein